MSQEKRKKFTIADDEVGQRLDVFLSRKLEDFSRAWLQKLIDEGSVKVGRKKVSKSYKLKKGENIFINIELPPEISLEPEKKPGDKVGIVFENDDFIIINKPAGLVVHPSSSTPSGTLANWLIYKYPKIKNVGESKIRPGIVHRLDKDTSGLMVIALNNRSFQWLKKRFKDREVDKKYLALVVGRIEKDEGEISWPISRSKGDPIKQRAYKTKNKVPKGARSAKTFWRVIKRFPNFTYLEVVPKTGRKHQIRVHLKTLGYPVAWDKKYGGEKSKKPKHLGRVFLHASSLSFKSPKGDKFSFNVNLSDDLANTLNNLPFMLE